MKKRLYIWLMAAAVLAAMCGCASKPSFRPPEGTGWLEAWLAEEEEQAESLTFGELAEGFDWIVETEIVEISPAQEESVTLPNGESWTAVFRDYTLEIRASFPETETGRLRLRAEASYTGPEGTLTTPWRQTGWDGQRLKTGQTLWLYGSKHALETEPFTALPEDGLFLAVDDYGRVLPCRNVTQETLSTAQPGV